MLENHLTRSLGWQEPTEKCCRNESIGKLEDSRETGAKQPLWSNQTADKRKAENNFKKLLKRLFAGRYWKTVLKKLFPFNHKKIHIKWISQTNCPLLALKERLGGCMLLTRSSALNGFYRSTIYWLSQFNSKNLETFSMLQIIDFAPADVRQFRPKKKSIKIIKNILKV